MTDVFSKSPPRPKYTFRWDIELDTKYIKSLSSNTELSNRTLILKLASLLFLTSGVIRFPIWIYVT